jgi:hypothetical protein
MLPPKLRAAVQPLRLPSRCRRSLRRLLPLPPRHPRLSRQPPLLRQRL